MGTEIERKFLVAGNDLSVLGARECRKLTQGYLSKARGRTVRVRIDNDLAFLTVKGSPTGLVRPEFEYSIPVSEACEILALCEHPWIEKTRHLVEFAGLIWEVDEFHGDNLGLVVAEVELERADQVIQIPNWAGPEVTSYERYHNSRLIDRPYSLWSEQERAWPTPDSPTEPPPKTMRKAPL